jgi:hypothetical protein
MQGIGNDVPMTHDQRQKISQHGLCAEGVLKNHIASANHRKIIAWAHNFGTADQSGQEAIQLFEVHRLLVFKATKNPAEAFEFGIGQWL